MLADSLRALLAHSIDYAGLFPPANLALEPALRNQADFIRTTDAWMLGAFILPVPQFDAASAGISQFNSEHSLQVSALGAKTNDPATFLAALETACAAIVSFRAQHTGRTSINQLEMPLPNDADAGLLKKIRSRLRDLQLNAFWETPPTAAEQTIKLIAENNSGAPDPAFGYKLRTGGVTADAFPSSEQIARALVAATKHRVAIKFTAGLHHPVRQFHASVSTKMHGFLNVLGAGVLAAEHGWDEQQTVTMLDDEDAVSFSFQREFFSWREWKMATNRIPAHRKLVTSFGSCSFDEPRDDLRALKLF